MLSADLAPILSAILEFVREVSIIMVALILGFILLSVRR